MPAKKKSATKSQSAPATTDSIKADIHGALADARSKLKGAKGKNIDVKLKLLDQCTKIINDIWPC